jgi:hypothetical protein
MLSNNNLGWGSLVSFGFVLIYFVLGFVCLDQFQVR